MPRHSPDSDGKIALPITPMLDMTFQLLFFFIMNFNPADLEGQMEAALPARDQIDGGQVAAPKDLGPVLPTDLTIEVRTRPDGKGGISALFVREADGKSTPIDGLDALRRHLTDRRAASSNKEAIKIRADARLSIDNLLKVIDTSKAAGFTNTTLASPE